MIRNNFPNFLTLGNLVMGVLSIILIFEGQYQGAAYILLFAMVFDGLDGRTARLLGVQSDFGKELDSLCDVVSFGVAPALLIYRLSLAQFGVIGLAATLIFPCCGALRLARFNIISGSSKYFTGIPITAAGGTVAALSLWTGPNFAVSSLPIILLALSYLMISKIKYPNFKGLQLGVTKSAVLALIIIIAIILTEGKLILYMLSSYALLGIVLLVVEPQLVHIRNLTK